MGRIQNKKLSSLRILTMNYKTNQFNIVLNKRKPLSIVKLCVDNQVHNIIVLSTDPIRALLGTSIYLNRHNVITN